MALWSASSKQFGLVAAKSLARFVFTGGPFMIGESAPIPRLETVSGGFDDLAEEVRD